MSNEPESFSEREIDLRDTTATLQDTTLQPILEKICNKPKAMNGKIVITEPQDQPGSSVTVDIVPNTPSAGSANSNTTVGGEPRTGNQNKKSNQKSKKSMQKKKEKPKNLTITMPNPSNTSNVIVNNSNSAVHDLFKNEISPLYTSANSRYLENLAHHPQYQQALKMQNLKNMFQNIVVAQHNIQQHSPVMLPYSPLLQMSMSPNPSGSSASPSEPQSPKYLQNMMQHPILNNSFQSQSFWNNQQFGPNPYNIKNLACNSDQNTGRNNKNLKKKNKNKDENNSDVKFDPYITVEEVTQGLNDNTLVEGVLRINPKLFQHSYVSSTDRSEQDILIDGIKNRNRALEGDVVVVQYIAEDADDNSEGDKQKKGKIVYIKEKIHPRTCIGTLKLMADKNRQKALFTPRDHRIPRLNIPFTCWPDNFYKEAKNYENTLFLAKIMEWFDTRFALGYILCNIGQSGDMQTETKAILAQTSLDVTPFGPEVRHLYPRLDYTIPEEEFKLREDCRKLCLFSIDPFNCRDIDDAVSCRELENGNYEIGVHISDVAHFLNENTILDEKVAEKATTIYLVEKAYHMLPDDLCMLCSLFPGVDKLAFSVFWEITKDAKVLNHRFSKTVIHSCSQLAYDHAQAILEDKENSKIDFPETYNGFGYDDIYKSIKIIGQIASIFRRKRYEDGALRIDQPKVSFHLDTSNGLPDSFWIYESQQSHQLIEEFMLLANMTVARRIYEDHPNLAFLRCHPPPSGFMLKQLAKSLKPMGIDLNVSSAGDLQKSLLQYVGPDCTDRGKAMVLNMLCAKPMARAKYFCAHGCDDEDFHHYALNVPLYTHFTSPIRRYADIMVHRLLAASLKYRDAPNWDVDKVRMIAAQCNKQKYNAKKAGELSTELYTLKYIELQSPFITEAVVVDVRDKYIDVIVVAMGLNRRIFFNNDFSGKYQCIKNEGSAKLSKMEITWNATDDLKEMKQVIEVFSTLQVELHKGDDMVKVETKLVRPTQSI